MDIKLEESARILLKFIQNTKPFNDLKDISEFEHINSPLYEYCLLYTSDAADE